MFRRSFIIGIFIVYSTTLLANYDCRWISSTIFGFHAWNAGRCDKNAIEQFQKISQICNKENFLKMFQDDCQKKKYEPWFCANLHLFKKTGNEKSQLETVIALSNLLLREKVTLEEMESYQMPELGSEGRGESITRENCTRRAAILMAFKAKDFLVHKMGDLIDRKDFGKCNEYLKEIDVIAKEFISSKIKYCGQVISLETGVNDQKKIMDSVRGELCHQLEVACRLMERI